jgi:hypothetical protein
MKAEQEVAAERLRKARHTRVEFYLRNVSRRWKRAVHGADRVLVLSPYLTSKTAEMILTTTPGERCAVYTVFEAENFAAGASSIHTLMRLRGHGCELYHLPALHAKIVLVPGVFASIGSQNMTRRGTLNREATSVYTAPETVSAIWEMVQPWLSDGRAITDVMIDDLNLALRQITPAMRKAQRVCKAIDERIWEAERDRAAERKRIAAEELARQELMKQAEEATRMERICKVVAQQEKLGEILATNSVSSVVAGELIAASAWWLTHRYGPTRAPNHRYNIYGRDGQWSIDFGANTLDITLAIDSSSRVLKYWLDQKMAGEDASLECLISRLEDVVTSSVHHQNGRYYDDYRSWSGFMRLLFRVLEGCLTGIND